MLTICTSSSLVFSGFDLEPRKIDPASVSEKLTCGGWVCFIWKTYLRYKAKKAREITNVIAPSIDELIDNLPAVSILMFVFRDDMSPRVMA